MTKKFAIVLALFVISIVCCAGCIGPGDNEDPEIPDVPDVPDVPVTPVDPVDPVVPVEEYSVMFMLNYGDAGAYTAETVKAGETVSKPATPTRSGYTFKGWFTAAEGGAAYDFTQAVNADLTLYAQWSKKSSSGSGSSTPKHTHSYTATVTKPETCGADGVKTFTCGGCGDSYTEVIPATGQHSLKTYTGEGGTVFVCSVCGFTTTPVTSEVALIGSQVYASIAEANSTAQDGDTIILLKDCSGDITKDVIINGNDKTATLNYDNVDYINILAANSTGLIINLDGKKVYFEEEEDVEGYLVVAYTLDGSTYTVYNAKGLQTALNAINAIDSGDFTVNLADDIEGDVTVTQKPNVKITIDGKDKKFNGAITVDGKSSRYDTAFLTIQNVNFASDFISAAAFVNLGKSGDTNTRYVHGVTVKDCTFTFSGERLDVVAVKSYTGGDLDLVLNGCKITTDGMHSLLQVKNVESGLQVINCEVTDATEGLNLNSCYAVEMTGCTISADNYAVRFGEGSSGTGGVQETFSISNCKLTATADTGSVIIFREAADNAKLTLTGTTLNGATEISGDTADTIIIIDEVRKSKYMYEDEEGAYCISTPEALFAFAKSVNEDGKSYSSETVKLTADIDLKNKEWTPVGQTGGYSAKTYFQGVFDGGEHTIRNLNVIHHEMGTDSGKNYASGLFGFIDAADADIKNLKIDTAVVSGHHWCGVIAGYLTGTIENCQVIKAKVTCSHANNDACGDKAGVIVGYINSGTVKNCVVKDSTVTAGRDAGQVVGCAKETQVTDCSAEKVTVTAGEECTGANIRNEVIGRINS